MCSSGDWSCVGEAASVADGLRLLHLPLDLLLIDLGLPDESGLSLIREAARDEGRSFRIVVVTIFGDERSVIGAIAAGADGYLLKGTDYGNVPQALADMMAGIAPISPSIAGHLLRQIRRRDNAVPGDDPDAPTLTAREQQILSSLAKGLTYKEVAERQGISHHTVNDHLKAIYKKLSVKSRGEAIYRAAQAGLVDLGRKPGA